MGDGCNRESRPINLVELKRKKENLNLVMLGVL